MAILLKNFKNILSLPTGCSNTTGINYAQNSTASVLFYMPYELCHKSNITIFDPSFKKFLSFTMYELYIMKVFIIVNVKHKSYNMNLHYFSKPMVKHTST